jgi:oligopeptidase B
MNASIPKINKILNTVKIHNEELIDNYSWIKQKDWKEVILNPNKLNAQVKKYLDEENLFKENQLKDIKDIEKKLFEELKSKIKNEDNSVPKKDGDIFMATNIIKIVNIQFIIEKISQKILKKLF